MAARRTTVLTNVSIWLRLALGWWRLKWNDCPNCNSDAPEIDNCLVCFSARDPYPPTSNTKALWRSRFVRITEGGGRLFCISRPHEWVRDESAGADWRTAYCLNCEAVRGTRKQWS